MISRAFDRREALTMVASIGTCAARSKVAIAESPPSLATATHQFTFLEPTRALPSVSLARLVGASAVLAAHRKPLILNFWATWCEACREDLRLLERFYLAEGSRVDVAAVNVDAFRAPADIRGFLEELGVRALPVYLDPNQKLIHARVNDLEVFPGTFQLPAHYVVTPSGSVAGYIYGVVDWLKADAQALLSSIASQ